MSNDTEMPGSSSGADRSVNRREMIGAAALGVAGATLAAGATTAVAAGSPGKSGVNVPNDGKYTTTPLRRETLKVTAVQSRIRGVRDTKNPAREMQANVDHMVDLIDAANGFPGPQDLVCFHEQPIQGWNPWTLEETLRVAIDVPGPETEQLGRKARQYGCYITFGTYARDKDWPGHVLLNGVLIGPDGKVRANHWKTNNIRGGLPGWDMFTTSIYDVLDRYREMYGEDAVLPIARTEIGNLSCSVTPMQPDVMRAHAMKGLEIRLSSSSGGYILEDAQMISFHNRLWSVVCNPSISPDHPGFPEFAGSGDTAIFGPNGRIAARARSANEEFVTTTIPIGEFRRTRSIPDVPISMLMPVHAKYIARYAPNLQASYVPPTSQDAARWFAGKKAW